jgi:hypothetical protein
MIAVSRLPLAISGTHCQPAPRGIGAARLGAVVKPPEPSSCDIVQAFSCSQAANLSNRGASNNDPRLELPCIIATVTKTKNEFHFLASITANAILFNP